MTAARLVPLLAALCTLLALACAGLAWRAEHARRTALCWRDLAEEGLAPEGRCATP